ncbi:MAG TPA: hypothetical protein VFH74_11820 [Gaiellales bacterium]|nr:hypothetical protein [Gaiellales bacterium]
MAGQTGALNIHAEALITLARLEAAANRADAARPHAERAIKLWEAKENRTAARRGRVLLDDLARPFARQPLAHQWPYADMRSVRDALPPRRIDSGEPQTP